MSTISITTSDAHGHQAGDDALRHIAQSISERARLTIAHTESDVAPIVTVSIGVAAYFPILEGADAALYQAKEKSRDRSFCAETTASP